MSHPLILPQRLVDPVPMHTQALYDRWCWRHRGRYMQIWAECRKEGMNTVDCKMYAKLEIVRLVESGQLSDDMTNVTPLDDVSKDPILPRARGLGAPPTVPSEDRAPDRPTPTEDEAMEAAVAHVQQAIIDQVTGALPPNPAHAPLKLRPRLAPLINNRCATCGGIDPCHQAWCSFVPNRLKSLIPPLPIESGDTIKPEDMIGPRQPKPGDLIPARYPFLKDRRVPWTMAAYYGMHDHDEWNEGRYGSYD